MAEETSLSPKLHLPKRVAGSVLPLTHGVDRCWSVAYVA